ncbi:MAG TPA: HigA family addiction module antitoxin [Bryobacteraceae bacterium]|jgi:addiction module HigA family antidote|nr:HigA family addiction module antitoxin [Bryobacteraceae bacterium]
MTPQLLTTTRKAKADDALLPLVTPGEYLVEEFLEPLELSANALATALKVPANRIQAIIKGQRGITADTALRLAQYFGTSAEFWMNLQQAYELDSARRDKLVDIQREIPRRPPAKQEAPSKGRKRNAR